MMFRNPHHKIALSLTGIILAACGTQAAVSNSTATQNNNGAATPLPTASSTSWQKPVWLTDLSGGFKESYDDNVLLVADRTPGLAAKSSWVTTLSPKVGFNFAPLLGDQNTLSALTLAYTPDFNFYHEAPSENYDAHKIANAIKGKTGELSFSVDNVFLYNDGNEVAPIYALSPASANDKNRSAYATAVPRERRKQIQERNTIVLQYDLHDFFIRPTASLLDYDLMTDWHKSAAAYTGYQNYVDRSDVNGGLDVGYYLFKNLAVTVGYRYGHQIQQALPASVDTLAAINGQPPHATADYQRLLFGLEGKPLDWLAVKLLGSPEFRVYNSAAPVADDNSINYYGEASIIANITAKHTLAFTYKHCQWVSSTGKLPYADNTYQLNYHWNATKQLGLDLTGKYLFSDYNCASSALSAGQSLRNDAQYTLSAAASYAFTKQFSTSLAYTYDLGVNQQDNVGALEEYRNFNHQLISVSALYKF